MPSDLTLNPKYPLGINIEYNTLVSTFDNGVEQRRAKRASAIREWTLTYENISSSDYDILDTLFNSKRGALTAFTWDNPEDGQTYTVRFKDDSFKSSYKSFGLYDCSFTLRQVL